MSADALLVIDGTALVRLEGRPAQGTRHQVLFGSVLNTGEPVVVKLERVPDTLEVERRALAWLDGRSRQAPGLVTAGAALIDGESVACLVTERRTGDSPSTADGWRRMGRAVARLADLGYPQDGLTLADHRSFGEGHAERIDDLGDRLALLADSVPDWALLTSADVPGSTPLVLTHGDPGPGNFLDDGSDGTLIDWEEAHVAPLGLDLARLVVIALLGAGPAGYIARDHQARADAVVAGYLAELRTPWRPSAHESRWWIAVAGIQFAHRRWQLGGQPAPWPDALEVLRSALTARHAWIQP